MIKIDMKKNGFIITGHADYEENGKDIVCASVSTILQLAQMGLHQLANQYPDHVQIRDEEIKCECAYCIDAMLCEQGYDCIHCCQWDCENYSGRNQIKEEK